jgi:type I site-specific restriction-modification system R (restriction) subunit
MLDREVADESFRDNRIPEIRKIAQPVKKYSKQILSEILDNAIEATMQALPPMGNRMAGIVWQTLGSGLGSSLVSYLKLIRSLPKIENNHVVILVDRIDLATQIYYLISNLDSEYSLGIVYCPETKPELVELLESNEPKIIVSTIQKLEPKTFIFDQDCLLIGYNLHGMPNRLPEMFPQATSILFTNILIKPNSGLLQIFGDVVGAYDLKQAISDGVAKPVTIERRKITIRNDHPVDTAEYLQSEWGIPLNAPKMTLEFIDLLAADLVQHFETRQMHWTGKGVVVIPDRYTGLALSRAISHIRPPWHGDTEFTGSVKAISAIESPTQRAILVDRFRKENDALILLLATGSFLQGYDNPLINTIYVTNPVSLQLYYTLASLVSRPYKGKKDGLIVDYVGLDWALEDLL